MIEPKPERARAVLDFANEKWDEDGYEAVIEAFAMLIAEDLAAQPSRDDEAQAKDTFAVWFGDLMRLVEHHTKRMARV